MAQTETLTVTATAEGNYVRLVVRHNGFLLSDLRVPRWPDGELAQPIVARHLADMIRELDRHHEGPFVIRIGPSLSVDGKWTASVFRERDEWRSPDDFEKREDAEAWVSYAIARLVHGGVLQCGLSHWTLDALRDEFEKGDAR